MNDVKLKASTVSARASKLIDLLFDLRRLSATDPRDKIYAALNLSTDALGTREIDYNLSPAKVFQHFATCLLKRGDVVRVLHAATSHPQTMNLPSCVPDWSSQKCLFKP